MKQYGKEQIKNQSNIKLEGGSAQGQAVLSGSGQGWAILSGSGQEWAIFSGSQQNTLQDRLQDRLQDSLQAAWKPQATRKGDGEETAGAPEGGTGMIKAGRRWEKLKAQAKSSLVDRSH